MDPTPDAVLSLIIQGTAVATALFGLFVAWFEWRFKAVFPSREEVGEEFQKVAKEFDKAAEARGHLHARATRARDLAVANQERISLAEQRIDDNERRATEMIKEPLDRLTQEVRALAVSVNDMRSSLSTEVARHGQDIHSLGRDMDEVRDRVRSLEQEGRK